MDSFISKLKSTVSEVLPGNPLSSDYDIQERSVGSAGPNMVWNIHRATKKTTKEAASVFVFNKKTIDKMPKEDKKQIIASLRRGIQQLTKLRHPKILSVVHPLEENRDCLAFATEPVRISLANVLEHSSGEQAIKLSEVEIKYGLIQILEAVTFLHNDVKLVHGGIHPSSIIINDKAIWKLTGFDFFSANSSMNTETVQFTCNNWCSGAPKSIQPDLDYLAPECGSRNYCDTKSDIYSLGVTIHAIYNEGKPLYQCHDSLASFKQLTSEMKSFRSSLLRNIPASFHDTFKPMLSLNGAERPEAKSLLKLTHFGDPLVMTIVYLDSLVQRGNLEKSQFYKNLPNMLKQLPLKICLYRMLPTLFSECSNRDMIPFVLQNILIIAELCSKEEYAVHIFPKLCPIFKMTQPIQIPLLLLKNMRTLLSQTNDGETKAYILPMLFSSIEIENSQLQELCLEILPEFSRLIDAHAMKTSVIPRIRTLCISTQYLNLRVKCLISIGKMLTHMDKWFVLDEVLPFLPNIPSKEPPVLMAILGIYKIAFSSKELGIPKDHLATKSLPFLIPLCAEHGLSKQQFIAYMSVIKDMMSTVESESLAKLEEVEKQQKQDSTLTFNGHQPLGDSVGDQMQQFLGEVGLLGTPAVKPSVAPSKPLTMSSPSVKETRKSLVPQVKDLTATLGSTTMQPVKQPPVASSNVMRPQTNQQFTSTKSMTSLQSGGFALPPQGLTLGAKATPSTNFGTPLLPSASSFSNASMNTLVNQHMKSMGGGMTQPVASTGSKGTFPMGNQQLGNIFGQSYSTPRNQVNSTNTQQTGMVGCARPQSSSTGNLGSWGNQSANQMTGWSISPPPSNMPAYGNYSSNNAVGSPLIQPPTNVKPGALSQDDINDLLG